MTWTLVALGIAIAIMLVGFLTGRDLSDKQRTARIRKFSALAVVPLILTLVLPKPYVARPYPSPTQPSSETNLVESSPVEKANEIRRLQDEVFKVRTDLAEVNDYYGNISRTTLFIFLGFLLSYAFRKGEEVEEINRTPLGLNVDDK